MNHPNHAFEYFEDTQTMGIAAKTDSSSRTIPIKNLCDSTSGFGGKSQLMQEARTSAKQIPVLKGDSIGRYDQRKLYWFDFRRENITGRTTDESKLGASPKILLRKTGDRIIATYDDSGVFAEQSLYFFYNNRTEIDLKFLLGVLNSRLLTAYYRTKSLTNKKSIAQVKKVDLDQLPIPVLDLSAPEDKAKHDVTVRLVERMLELHRRKADKLLPQSEREEIEREIALTDQEIDTMVYDLYGLTEEERLMVEETSGH